MANWISFFALILPWIFLPIQNCSDSFRLPKSSALDLMFLGAIVIALFKGLKFTYINKYLSIFIAYLFFSIFIYWYIPFSVILNHRQVMNISMLESMIHSILAVVFVIIALSYLDRNNFIKNFKVGMYI